MLEGIKLTKNGVFVKNDRNSYIYVDVCKRCGEPYLTQKHDPGDFCCRSCATAGSGHWAYGKHLSDEHKSKLSVAFKGEKNHFYGKKHTKKSRDIISKKATGRKFSDEDKKKRSEVRTGVKIHSEKYKQYLSKKFTGKNNPMYGVCGEKHPSFGKPLSDETKRKLSEANKGKMCGEDNPNWKGGISTEPYCQIWNNELKDYIKYRDDYICQNPYCFRGGSVLCVHHVDFNKKNCEPSNLISVCKSCNAFANYDRDWHTAWYQAFLTNKFGYVY